MKKMALGMVLVLLVFGPLASADLSSVEVTFTGMPEPLVGTADTVVDVTPQSAVMLSDVPTSRWYYGCSATSAGMMFGYYDRTGYSNMYTGTVNGGVAPLTELGHTTSLVATKQGVDGVTSKAHVDDYWVATNAAGPDPWEGNWAEHTWGDCTADFMGTNQWKWDYISSDGIKDFNKDGGTALWSAGSGAKLYDYVPSASAGLPQTSLCHGMRLFAESRGYTVVENYTQKIDTVATGGFSFADYMNEINSGRPVMIQVTGHSMVGVGYDAANNTMYLHDTWDNNVHSMTWGTSYSGMAHQAMTVIELAQVPAPAALLLGMIGLGLIGRLKRRVA